MDYREILALLRGPRLGPDSTSVLSCLIKETKELFEKQSIASRSEFEKFKSLQDTCLELQLGGSCIHGADQGEQCLRCKKLPGGPHLQGPQANKPRGLEVAEHYARMLGLSERKEAVLNREFDRVNDTLKQVRDWLKEMERKQVTKFLAAKKRLQQESVDGPASKILVPESLVKIKEMSGVRLQSAYAGGKGMHRVLRIQVRGLKQTVQVEINLTAQAGGGEEDVFAQLVADIEAKQLACFGRRMRITHLLSPRDTVLRSTDALFEFFEDYEEGSAGEDVFLIDGGKARGVEHEAFAICYEKCCRHATMAPNLPLLDALKQHSASTTALTLMYKSYALDSNLFESIGLHANITELNLGSTVFDLKESCHAMGTLAQLRRLDISRPLLPVRKLNLDLMDLVTALRVWDERSLIQLQSINLSNWAMLGSNALPEFTKSLVRFIKNHVALGELQLNRCFHLEMHTFLGDEQVDSALEFTAELNHVLLGGHFQALEFASNCFFADCDLLPGVLFGEGERRLRSVSLNNCRTWDPEESEELHLVPVLTLPPALALPRSANAFLVELNLGECNLGDAGMFELCAHRFPSMEVLNLCSVQAGVQGMHALFRAMRMAEGSSSFPQLRVLNISGNASNAFVADGMTSADAMASLANIREEIKMQGYCGLSALDFAPFSRLQRLTIGKEEEGDLDCHALFQQVLPSLQELTVFSFNPPPESLAQSVRITQRFGAFVIHRI